MRYVIDGYNLLHATGHLSGTVTAPGLVRARRALLDQLVQRHGQAASCVTVVFDVRRVSPRIPDEESYHGVRILYALGKEADDVIEELIRLDTAPRTLTIVSNDNRLRVAARRRRCLVLDCVDYFETLTRAEVALPVARVDVGKPEVSSEALTAELEQAFLLPPDNDALPRPRRPRR